MPISTLLTEVTLPKLLTVNIAGKTISPDDLILVEFADDFFTFGTQGIITIRDSYSFANSKDITFDGNTPVTISCIDYQKFRYAWSFTITDMQVSPANRANLLTFTICDPFYYKLSNLYISKSFSGTITDAFSSIIGQYKLDTLLKTSKRNLTVESGGENKKFVFSSNRSVLDTILFEFRLANLRIWQDNENVYVKEFKVSDAKDVTSKQGTVKYSNIAFNNTYMFKIHDMKKRNFSRSNMVAFAPVQEVVRFKNKELITDTVNLSDFYSSMCLNSDKTFATMQDTTGKKFSIRVDSLEAQKFDLFNTFIRNEELDIVIPGSIEHNQLGYIANVELGERSQYSKATTLGDRKSSGRYLITRVHNRFLNSAFMTKLRLSRFDSQKV